MQNAPCSALLVLTCLAPALAAAQTPSGFVEQHCTACHNDRARVGGLSLSGADPARLVLGNGGANRELWENVLHKLRTGQMPPAGRPQPDAGGLARVDGVAGKGAGCGRVGEADARARRRAPVEPHGIRQRDPRPARGGRGREGAAPAGRIRRGLRQRRGQPGDVAGARRTLPHRGARGQPHRGRRRDFRRRAGVGPYRVPRLLEQDVRIDAATAVRVARRAGRAPRLPPRRRVHLQGPAAPAGLRLHRRDGPRAGARPAHRRRPGEALHGGRRGNWDAGAADLERRDRRRDAVRTLHARRRRGARGEGDGQRRRRTCQRVLRRHGRGSPRACSSRCRWISAAVRTSSSTATPRWTRCRSPARTAPAAPATRPAAARSSRAGRSSPRKSPGAPAASSPRSRAAPIDGRRRGEEVETLLALLRRGEEGPRVRSRHPGCHRAHAGQLQFPVANRAASGRPSGRRPPARSGGSAISISPPACPSSSGAASPTTAARPGGQGPAHDPAALARRSRG